MIEIPQIIALQRTNLIENRISFISGSGQIFLSFLGCCFESNIAEQLSDTKALNGTAQMIFLYVFYNFLDPVENLNLTQIVNSMITARESDAGIAVDGSNSKKIANPDQISYQDFVDVGGFIVEVWKYNPLPLSYNECINNLSLILEMTDYKDERIQNCLDEIRNKYGIEVDDAGEKISVYCYNAHSKL